MNIHVDTLIAVSTFLISLVALGGGLWWRIHMSIARNREQARADLKETEARLTARDTELAKSIQTTREEFVRGDVFDRHMSRLEERLTSVELQIRETARETHSLMQKMIEAVTRGQN